MEGGGGWTGGGGGGPSPYIFFNCHASQAPVWGGIQFSVNFTVSCFLTSPTKAQTLMKWDIFCESRNGTTTAQKCVCRIDCA